MGVCVYVCARSKKRERESKRLREWESEREHWAHWVIRYWWCIIKCYNYQEKCCSYRSNRLYYRFLSSVIHWLEVQLGHVAVVFSIYECLHCLQSIFLKPRDLSSPALTWQEKKKKKKEVTHTWLVQSGLGWVTASKQTGGYSDRQWDRSTGGREGTLEDIGRVAKSINSLFIFLQK